jgi:hypothetical protein
MDGVFGAGVDLMWLPLGAGGHVVRLTGKGLRGAVRPGSAPSPARSVPTRPSRWRRAARARSSSWPVPDRDGGHRGVVGEGPAPVKCGTRTRSSPGCWSRPALTWLASARPRVAAPGLERRAGRRAAGHRGVNLARSAGAGRSAGASKSRHGRASEPARQGRGGEHDATRRRRGGGGHQPAARAGLRLLQ